MVWTEEYIKGKVQEIRDCLPHDYEKAHGLEDQLYYELLVYIGNRTPTYDQFHGLIREAVKAHKIEFPRYTS